jgi:hypothetical protein
MLMLNCYLTTKSTKYTLKDTKVDIKYQISHSLGALGEFLCVLCGLKDILFNAGHFQIGSNFTCKQSEWVQRDRFENYSFDNLFNFTTFKILPEL